MTSPPGSVYEEVVVVRSNRVLDPSSRPPGACTKTVDRKEYAGCYYSICVDLIS